MFRLVATFLFVNVVCGQGYQPHSDEYIYQQQPLQHYDGYETHRQYRSAGDEPTTITPSVTLKVVNTILKDPFIYLLNIMCLF